MERGTGPGAPGEAPSSSGPAEAQAPRPTVAAATPETGPVAGRVATDRLPEPTPPSAAGEAPGLRSARIRAAVPAGSIRSLPRSRRRRIAGPGLPVLTLLALCAVVLVQALTPAPAILAAPPSLPAPDPGSGRPVRIPAAPVLELPATASTAGPSADGLRAAQPLPPLEGRLRQVVHRAAGRVVDGEGRGVAGARLLLEPLPEGPLADPLAARLRGPATGSELVELGRSAEDGTFLLEDLTPGGRIWAEGGDRNHAWEDLPGLRAGQASLELRLVLAALGPEAHLAGRVVDTAGDLVRTGRRLDELVLQVRRAADPDPAWETLRGAVASDGSFRVRALGSGEHHLRVQLPWGLTLLEATPGAEDLRLELPPIELPPDAELPGGWVVEEPPAR